jgi:hypothetical protein
MSIIVARDCIATALDAIPGLRVFDHIPDGIQEFPAAAMQLESVSYTDLSYTFRLLLAIQVWDEGQVPTDLDPYLENAGTYSLKARLDMESECVTVGAHRVEKKMINGVPYTGAEILIVYTDTP